MKIIICLLFSIILNAQNNCLKEKKEAINVIKKLNFSYSTKDNNIKNFFSDLILCVVCENKNNYDNDFLIKKNDFIINNLDEAMVFLRYEKIKNSRNSFVKQENSYILYYQTAKPNKKIGFEGSSVIITFKKENGSLKIYAVQTIP